MPERKSRILIADDDREIRDILTLLLTAEGYDVTAACDGQEAVSLAGEDIDLYILDVNMPVMSGFAAAAEIRKHSYAPMLFLTAYSGESDKVMGFSVGADDYLVKPFSNSELLLRVRAHLRRAQQYAPAQAQQHTSAQGQQHASAQMQRHTVTQAVGAGSPPDLSPNQRSSGETADSSDVIIYKDLTFDKDTQSVQKDGRVIVLTHTEYRILELFLTHPKKIFSLDNIYQSVWEEDAVGDSTIMVHIKNLRKKLGDDSRNPRYIKTAWGKGYYVD